MERVIEKISQARKDFPVLNAELNEFGRVEKKHILLFASGA